MKTIILTQKIAKQFLADEDYVRLSEFTSIEVAAAQTLAKHEGQLRLDGEAKKAVNRARRRLAKKPKAKK